MPTCTRCHATWDDTFKFCPHDGTPLGTTAKEFAEYPRTCLKCGAKYAGGRFCVHDGSLLDVK